MDSIIANSIVESKIDLREIFSKENSICLYNLRMEIF